MSKELKNKKVAIFVADLYEELEAWYPYYRLKEAGVEVVFVGSENKEYTGKHGYPARAEAGIKEVNAEDFDALVIPGGYAPDKMRRSEEMVRFTNDMHKAGKPVAAICHAGWMLASADILRGVRATGFYSIKDDMENAGAKWEDAEVVRDKNIITSRNPDDLPAFMHELLKALEE